MNEIQSRLIELKKEYRRQETEVRDQRSEVRDRSLREQQKMNAGMVEEPEARGRNLRYWILDSGSWMLVIGYRILANPEESTLRPHRTIRLEMPPHKVLRSRTTYPNYNLRILGERNKLAREIVNGRCEECGYLGDGLFRRRLPEIRRTGGEQRP
jgi:hypothetical protein